MSAALDRHVTLRQVLSLLLVISVVSLALGIILGGLVATPGPTEPDRQPDPVVFTAESQADEDRIVHTFAPNAEEQLPYRVSYVVLENGTEIQRVDGRTENLSADEPLVVEVEERRANAEYAFSLTIHDDLDDVVYDARIVVGSRQRGR